MPTTWDIGSATPGDNVDGDAADYTSIGSALADTTNVVAGDTLRLVRNAELSGGSALTVGRQLTITAHADCAVSAPTYDDATSKARIDVSATRIGVSITASGVVLEKIAVNNEIRALESCTIRRLVQLLTHSGDQNAVQVGTGGASGWSVTVANCAAIHKSAGGVGYYIYDSTSTLTTYHCSHLARSTIYAAYYRDAGTHQDFACIAQAISGTPQGWNNASAGCDYNVSEDATAPGSGATYYYRSTSGWFADIGAGTEDLSLAAGKQGEWDNASKEVIPDYSAQDCATDIAGTTRAAPIDPGVWQTPAAAATTYPWRLLLLGVG